MSKIKSILDSGYQNVKYLKVFYTDDENIAYEYEVSVIRFIGLHNLTNLNEGGRGGINPSQETRAKLKDVWNIPGAIFSSSV